MKSILLPIGKMAEINHITISTLRLYDKLGLLPPRYIEPETGYRYYDVYQNARLDMIAYMKEVGMSLGEIKNVFQREDVSIIEEVLAKKNELLHEQMRELKSRHSAVERAIASIERYRKSPVTGTTSLEYIDRRYTWGIPCRSNFYEGDIGEYEKVLIELRKELIAHSFQHMIGIAAERPVDLPAAEDRNSRTTPRALTARQTVAILAPMPLHTVRRLGWLRVVFPVWRYR